jgi:hypothetical protein
VSAPDVRAELQAAGHSAFVLLALGLGPIDGGDTISGLAARLGMTRSVVRGHLQRLQRTGLVVSHASGWELTRRAQRLLLACSGLEPSAPPPDADRASAGRGGTRRRAPVADSAPAERATAAPTSGANRADGPLDAGANRAKSPPSSTTEVLNHPSEKTIGEEARPKRRKRPSAAERRIRANLAAFRAEGVGSNRRVNELCERGYVTPEYIRGLAANLRSEQRFRAGVLILAVDHHDPLPRDHNDAQAYIDSLRAFGYDV